MRYRSIKKNDKWYPEYKFKLFYIIPIWIECIKIVGDLVLGEYEETLFFNSKEECDKWVNQAEKML